MTELDYYNINLRIASAILLGEGKLSLSKIRALPYIDSESADLIKNTLIQLYDVDIKQQKHNKSGLPYWEDILVLRK